MLKLKIFFIFNIIVLPFCFSAKAEEIKLGDKSIHLAVIDETSTPFVQDNDSKNELEKRAQTLSNKVQNFWDSPKLLRMRSKAPSSWNFLGRESFQIFIKDKLVNAKQSLYDFKDYGLTLIEIDEDNFFLTRASETQDNLTGEKKFTYGLDSSFGVYKNAFLPWAKRKIGNTSVSLNGLNGNGPKNIQFLIEGEMPVAITFPLSEDEEYKYARRMLEFETENDIWTEINRLLYSMAYFEIPKHLQRRKEGIINYYTHAMDSVNNIIDAFTPLDDKLEVAFDYMLTFSPNDNGYNKFIPGMQKKTSGGTWTLMVPEIPLGFLTKDKKNFYWFNETGKGKRYFLYGDEAQEGVYIPEWSSGHVIDLAFSDIITERSQDGKIITLNLNDGDYLKYSMFADAIFEGKIKRKDGLFNFNLDVNDGNPLVSYIPGEFIFNQDYSTPYETNDTYHKYGGECIIPTGSKIITNFPRTILMKESPGKYLLESKPINTWIYNSQGEHTHTIKNKFVYWKDSDKVEAKKKEAEMNEYVAKQRPYYDALSAKYGQKYVNAAIRGEVIVGMPIGLILEVFENEIWHNYDDNYKVYRIGVRPALYVDDLKKITAKREANYFYPFSERLIHVKNGRVSSITYYY